jgi:hypothetical protein
MPRAADRTAPRCAKDFVKNAASRRPHGTTPVGIRFDDSPASLPFRPPVAEGRPGAPGRRRSFRPRTSRF